MAEDRSSGAVLNAIGDDRELLRAVSALVLWFEDRRCDRAVEAPADLLLSNA